MLSSTYWAVCRRGREMPVIGADRAGSDRPERRLSRCAAVAESLLNRRGVERSAVGATTALKAMNVVQAALLGAGNDRVDPSSLVPVGGSMPPHYCEGRPAMVVGCSLNWLVWRGIRWVQSTGDSCLQWLRTVANDWP
jgi:hypothetical protein